MTPQEAYGESPRYELCVGGAPVIVTRQAGVWTAWVEWWPAICFSNILRCQAVEGLRALCRFPEEEKSNVH